MKPSWLRYCAMALAVSNWSLAVMIVVLTTSTDHLVIKAAALTPVLLGMPILLRASRLLELAAQTEAMAQANRDDLTGLWSRAYFLRTIGEAARSHTPIAVMFLDLDRFKGVNDSLGHHTGDRLPVQVAKRMQAFTDSRTILARLGGDEFAVLQTGGNRVDAERLADLLLATCQRPFIINGHELVATMSIGIVVSEDAQVPPEELLRRADVALYAAKARGRNRWQMFQPGVTLVEQDGLRLDADVRPAFNRNEFVLHYQPEIDLRTGNVTGFEALVRWRHPRLGLLPPSMFLDPIEDAGLTHALSRWALRRACSEAIRWQGQGSGIGVSVNLTAGDFLEAGLVNEITGILADTGLNPTLLRIELVESAFLIDLDMALATLAKLRDLGIKIAIDDFGTGYSSLSYLRKLPVDVIKLDKEFISEASHDVAVRSIIRTVIQLAHALQIEVTAEGVENRDQLKFLLECDCDRAQGYLFSRPMPVENVSRYLGLEKRETAVA